VLSGNLIKHIKLLAIQPCYPFLDNRRSCSNLL